MAAPRILEFTIPGPPVPKARSRPFKNGHGKIVSTTPPRTRKYERSVRTVARVAALRVGWKPKTGNYKLCMDVYWHDRRRRDLSNIVKSVEDALNGVAWFDDSQVTELHILGAVDKDAPGVRVRVEELGCR